LETALHSPLIIRAPGMKQGLKTNALASSIDIYPTLIDLCKPTFTKTAHELDGVSLQPVLTGQKKQVNQYVVSTWNNATTYRFAKTNDRIIFRTKNGKHTDVEMYNMRNKNGAWINDTEIDSDDEHEVIEALLRDLEQ
ncbi:MAG: sulfatase/phosphatase domain-containing protein, partial [Phycisphaeraceae bacterium]